MPAIRLDEGRRQFQERLLIQFRARFRGWDFQSREDGFGLLARRGGRELTLSLDSLYAEVHRPGASAPAAISRFVAAAAPRLSSAEQLPERQASGPDPGALVWCVRGERVTRAYSRFAELATRELPAGLLAFVAEALPGEVMQGVSRPEAEAVGLSEEELRQHADRNTALRLTRWQRQLELDPDQRTWLFTGDVLFSSSLLLVPDFLARIASLGGGGATLAAPDRAMVMASVGHTDNPEGARQLVRRLYRLANFPLSPRLLATDGSSVTLHPIEGEGEQRRSGWRRLLGGGD